MKPQSRTPRPIRLFRALAVGGPMTLMMLGTDCPPEEEPPDLSDMYECSVASECCVGGQCQVGEACVLLGGSGHCDVTPVPGASCICSNSFSGPIDGGDPPQTEPPNPSFMGGSPEFEGFWGQVAANPDLRNATPASLAFFTAGCTNHVYQSCRHLGLLHLQTDPPDFAASAQAVDYSCAMGNPAGCFLRGAALHFGIGVTQDQSAATGYFNLACEWGDPRGCNPMPALQELANTYQPS